MPVAAAGSLARNVAGSTWGIVAVVMVVVQGFLQVLVVGLPSVHYLGLGSKGARAGVVVELLGLVVMFHQEVNREPMKQG